MQQLIRSRPGALEWAEVPEPDLQGALEALVRPIAVATCDLDGPIATGEAPIPDVIAMGHEGVAEVEAVGAGVQGIEVGDRVVVPFQIACGTCGRCRRGLTGSCERVPAQSMFGFGAFGGDWGGMLSDLLRVPYADAMLVPVAPELDPVAISSASEQPP